MLIENQHPHNRSVMVAVLGAPNAGKSSLINCLMGTELSVVTHLPQTTRNKIKCITCIDRTEIIFVDTPGVHKSSAELNKRLNQQAKEGVMGADVNWLLVDLTKDIFGQIRQFQEIFDVELKETWLIFTKSDCLETPEKLPLEEVFARAQEIIPALTRYFLVSAKTQDNVHVLTGAIVDRAPEGPHLFPDGDISDKNERFFAAEYIREQAFLLLKEELPYEVAVTIDDYRDFRGKDKSKLDCLISATIHVNRPSQRAIVVGSKGSMIREIGTRARKKIEAMVGGQVHLNLHAKVSPRWFKNNFILEEIGLPRALDSRRVWHKKAAVENKDLSLSEQSL